MITDENLPDGWTAASERVEYDELMGREYESKRYERDDGGAAVSINEVQEPESFEGWGYQVVADPGPESAEERVGLFEDVDAARDAAIEYMSDHPH